MRTTSASSISAPNGTTPRPSVLSTIVNSGSAASVVLVVVGSAVVEVKEAVVVVVTASVTVVESTVDVGTTLDAVVSIAPVEEDSSESAHPPTTRTKSTATAQVRKIKPLMLSITRLQAHE